MQSSEFRRHLEETYGIAGEDYSRLVEEFLAYFGSTLEEYVRARHLALQRLGKRNPEIFRQIVEESQTLRFAERDLSERRVRRLIYG